MLNSSIFWWSAVYVWLYMMAWFVAAVLRRNNGIVDVAWGGGFVLLAVLTLPSHAGSRAYLMLAMVVLWAVRLSAHIAWRNSLRPDEDFRYKAWRQQWGKAWVWRSFWQVFMLQGFFMWVVALPIMVVNGSAAANQGLGYADAAGVALFAVGWLIEAMADYQLLRFKLVAAHRHSLMTTGLWCYSRHPNYFGESLLWWGIWVVSASAGYCYVSVISPLVLTYLLRWVSGVPMLERRYRHHPDFAAYSQRTSVFVPMPPRVPQ